MLRGAFSDCSKIAATVPELLGTLLICTPLKCLVTMTRAKQYNSCTFLAVRSCVALLYCFVLLAQPWKHVNAVFSWTYTSTMALWRYQLKWVRLVMTVEFIRRDGPGANTFSCWPRDHALPFSAVLDSFLIVAGHKIDCIHNILCTLKNCTRPE